MREREGEGKGGGQEEEENESSPQNTCFLNVDSLHNEYNTKVSNFYVWILISL